MSLIVTIQTSMIPDVTRMVTNDASCSLTGVLMGDRARSPTPCGQPCVQFCCKVFGVSTMIVTPALDA